MNLRIYINRSFVHRLITICTFQDIVYSTELYLFFLIAETVGCSDWLGIGLSGSTARHEGQILFFLSFEVFTAIKI
jgi:hypothetical protein